MKSKKGCSCTATIRPCKKGCPVGYTLSKKHRCKCVPHKKVCPKPYVFRKGKCVRFTIHNKLKRCPLLDSGKAKCVFKNKKFVLAAKGRTVRPWLCGCHNPETHDQHHEKPEPEKPDTEEEDESDLPESESESYEDENEAKQEEKDLDAEQGSEDHQGELEKLEEEDHELEAENKKLKAKLADCAKKNQTAPTEPPTKPDESED